MISQVKSSKKFLRHNTRLSINKKFVCIYVLVRSARLVNTLSQKNDNNPSKNCDNDHYRNGKHRILVFASSLLLPKHLVLYFFYVWWTIDFLSLSSFTTNIAQTYRSIKEKRKTTKSRWKELSNLLWLHFQEAARNTTEE